MRCVIHSYEKYTILFKKDNLKKKLFKEKNEVAEEEPTSFIHQNEFYKLGGGKIIKNIFVL